MTSGWVHVFACLPGIEGRFESVVAMIESAGVAAMPGAAFGDARSEWLRFSMLSERIPTAIERLDAYVAARQ